MHSILQEAGWRKALRWPGSLVLVVALPALAVQGPTQITVADRDVAVWKPLGTAPAGGYPLVLFSHGFGGCNTQSVFLMDALALGRILRTGAQSSGRALRSGARR